MDFYKKITEYKAHNKITYGKLGAIVDKGEDAFRMALKRKTLSKLEIAKLSSELFNSVKTYNNHKVYSEEELNQLALQIIDLDVALKNNRIFNMYIQNKVQDGIIEYLEKDKNRDNN